MNILLTGAFNYSKEQFNDIGSLGYKITFVQEEREELNMDVSKFEVVVCNSLFMYNDIKKFKNLKAIQLTSAGLDRVPLKYINQNNIKLFNASGVYSIPIAEWTVLKILEVYKKSKDFIEQQKNKEWKKHRDLRELTNKNVGILGFGDIGKQIAKRLNAFDTNIYAFDIFEPKSGIYKKYDHIDNIYDYIEELDIVVLCLPLTNETRNLVDNRFLTKMKKNAVLVNISRGEIISTKDLISTLMSRQELMAVLDVFENEPLDNNNKLWELPNVQITPHNAYHSDHITSRLYKVIYSNLKKNNNNGG